MTLFFYLLIAILVIGIVFSVFGIRAFSQMRKYYKSLCDFEYYDYDFEGDD